MSLLTTEQFFARLYGKCSKGTIGLRALPSGTTTFCGLADYRDIEGFVGKNHKEDLYYAVATRNGGGTKDHIEQIPALWADIDFKDTSKEKAQKLIKALKYPPSIIIESGGGYHLYWLLLVPASKDAIPEVERTLQGIAVAVQGDKQVCDASRILRIPNTVNRKYKEGPLAAIIHNKSSYYSLTDLYKEYSIYNNATSVPGAITPDHKGNSFYRGNIYFAEGNRDESLFHAANCLVKGGMSVDNISTTLHKLAIACYLPFPYDEAEKKIQSALRRLEVHKGNIAAEVREWVEVTKGNFLSTEVHKELGYSTKVTKKAASMALRRLCEKGIIERFGSRVGSYRIVEKDLQPIDFLSAESEEFDFDWYLPSLNNLVKIYPGNVIVCAGDGNAGKTALCLALIHRNEQDHSIRYFSSEMGASELKNRLKDFDGKLLRDWNFRAYDRVSQFQDVIDPNGVNIIDYLELSDNFYLVGQYMAQIHEKLNRGIAIVCIQKKKGAPMGRGGDLGAEKARLYFTLSEPSPRRRMLKIEKCKNWRGRKDPNGEKVYYHLAGGVYPVEEDQG